MDFRITDAFTVSLAGLNVAEQRAVTTTTFDPQLNAPGPGLRGADQIRVKVKGVDVLKPQTGEIESGGPDTIALRFINTDCNEERFFVRHAYFLGAATDPDEGLKTTLKAEIDEEARESLRSDTFGPFAKPKSGRVVVKVINHLGDGVKKGFSVP